jgi:hypothetical protein
MAESMDESMAGLHLPDDSLDDCGEAKPAARKEKLKPEVKWRALWFIPPEALNIRHEDKPKREGFYTFDRLTCKTCQKTFHKTTGLELHTCLDGSRPGPVLAARSPGPPTRSRVAAKILKVAGKMLKVKYFDESDETAIEDYKAGVKRPRSSGLKTLGDAKEEAEEMEVEILYQQGARAEPMEEGGGQESDVEVSAECYEHRKTSPGPGRVAVTGREECPRYKGRPELAA